MVNRFDIYLVNLDPTLGSEIRKTRPAVIVSPNEINHHLNTVIVAPMTTTIRSYPTRVKINFQDKNGQIALDQIRTIDQTRLIKRLGTIKPSIAKSLTSILIEMFTL